jgi:hypothetical protein
LTYRSCVGADSAYELNRSLARERQIPWKASLGELPTGAVIVGGEGEARLITTGKLLSFSFEGWTDPIARVGQADVMVLTPRTSVVALANGFVPLLHPSAGCCSP